MTAVVVLLPQSRIVHHRHLRRFHQQRAQHAIALLADGAQLLPSARTRLPRNQSQITGHLFATAKTADIADGQHESQRRIRPDSRLRHQQFRLRVLLRRLLHRPVQFADLLIQHRQQSQQVLASAPRPWL